MEHYSFQGAFAYRWLNDVPVERIDLRNGERRALRLGPRRFPSPGGNADEGEGWRARMAAWN
jgi:hypothetical protein